MSKAAAGDELVLGGEPRVDLLPPEVKARQKAKTLRRGLVAAVVGAVVLLMVGVATVTWEAAQSEARLAGAQEHTAELLGEQTKYTEMRQIQDDVDATEVARRAGASTEVSWKDYLQGVRAILPADVVIDTVGVDSASPFTPYEQPTVPLQDARVATVTISLTSPTLPTVPDWLEAMKALPGYADGTPGLITRSDTGTYTLDLTLHINEGAFWNRFADPASSEVK